VGYAEGPPPVAKSHLMKQHIQQQAQALTNIYANNLVAPALSASHHKTTPAKLDRSSSVRESVSTVKDIENFTLKSCMEACVHPLKVEAGEGRIELRTCSLACLARY